MAKIYTIKQHRSLDRLYEETRGNLKRFLMSRLKNEQDAEDVLQECFIKLSSYSPDMGYTNPEGLLFKIAYTLSIDAIRKRNSDLNRETAWVSENVTCLSGEPVVDLPNVDRSLEARQRISKIIALLKELPPKCSQVFILHKFEGRSHGEVAVRMGISKSMVEKHMIRALKKLTPVRHEQG